MCVGSDGAVAQPLAGAGSKHELAMQLKSRVSNLITLPLENDLEFGVGSWDGTRNTLNIEPVVPFPLHNSKWRLVTRTILPLVYEDPAGAKDASGRSGIGDINMSCWVAPDHKINDWVFGTGAVLNLPTAHDSLFGYRKWAAGPTAVAVKQKGGVTYGIQLNHQWSFGGPGVSDVSATLIDPWMSYTWKNGFSVEVESASSYDWKASQWTVPFRFGIGHLLAGGPLPVNLELDGLEYVVRAADDPQWGLSLTVTFVLKR